MNTLFFPNVALVKFEAFTQDEIKKVIYNYLRVVIVDGFQMKIFMFNDVTVVLKTSDSA